MNLHEIFGNIDIYLFDQIMKGRFSKDMKILDAGCGNGRNLIYFLKTGYDIHAVDNSPLYISDVKQLAKKFNPLLPEDNFHAESLESITFENNHFDAVIASAVLHFAETDEQFHNMLNETWRVLKPGGLFFSRLASSIGLELRVSHLYGRRYHLPDGTDRYLVDEEMLMNLTKTMGGELVEPLKTTNVQNMRCMTTWCMRKRE